MEKIEFKGKKFNGSEGEFFAINYAGRWIDIQDSNHYGGINLLEADEAGDHAYESNARLFANSKNLLKAAIEVYKTSWENPKEYALKERAFKQLETEILKSL